MSGSHPARWIIARLGDVAAEIKNGLADKPSPEPPGVPMLRISAVRAGRVALDEHRFHQGSFADISGYALRDGDLLVVRYNGNPELTATCGMVRDVRTAVVYPDKLMRVRLHEHVACPAFIEAAMALPETRAQLDRFIKTAAGQHGISGKDLREIVLSLPPLAEQRRIVARIEALFARTRRARADLLRGAHLADRHAEAALGSAYSAGADSGLVQLGDLVDGLRYGTAQKCTVEPRGTTVLRIPNVAGGRIDLTDLKYAELDTKEQAKLCLVAGDILIIRSNGSPGLVGRPALVGDEAAGMAFAGYLIRARPRRERIVPGYLSFMLQAPQIRGHIEVNARSSSGVHNINTEELSALSIPVPSLEVQHAVVRALESSLAGGERASRDANRALALLDHLEQSILAKAFRGELVPQDPSDEPAEALLACLGADTAPPARPRRGRPPAMPAAIARMPPPMSGTTAPPPAAPARAAATASVPDIAATTAPHPEPDESGIACVIRAFFADAIVRPRDQAMRDLARALGHQRLGARIEERMHGALIMAVRRRILENTPDGLRLLTRAIGDYTREELQTQFLAALQGRAWTDQDDAIQSFARWLGFQRTGPVITEEATAAIRTLIRQGRLERDGRAIRRSG